MALQIKITTVHGLTIDNAYLRVDNINGTKDSLTFTASVYVSKQTSDNDKAPVAYETYNIAPSIADGAPNFIQQTYEYLKTLDKYVDAIDC